MQEEDRERGARIILVRHARPVIDPEVPAASWALAGDAAGAVARLAERLRDLGGDGVVTSPEPKARGTAGIIARCLDLPLAVDEALREQDAGNVPYLSNEAFLAAVEEHFRRRDEIVFGAESSAQAARRFASGVEAAQGRFRCPIVVTHGRVLCAYLVDAIGVDPVPLWRSLRLPDAFVVDLELRTWARVEGKGG